MNPSGKAFCDVYFTNIDPILMHVLEKILLLEQFLDLFVPTSNEKINKFLRSV